MMRKSMHIFLAVLVIVAPRISDEAAAVIAGVLLIAGFVLQWLGD